jgi:hypothetical protein
MLTDMQQYLTVEELADLTQQKMDENEDTGYSLSKELGMHSSNVYSALRNPQSRYKKILVKILEHYGVEVDLEEPRYEVKL